MPAPDKNKPKKVTVKCSECKAEVELTLEDDEYKGRCGECDWNVGAAYTKYRRDRSVRVIGEEMEAPEKKPKPSSFW